MLPEKRVCRQLRPLRIEHYFFLAALDRFLAGRLGPTPAATTARPSSSLFWSLESPTPLMRSRSRRASIGSQSSGGVLPRSSNKKRDGVQSTRLPYFAPTLGKAQTKVILGAGHPHVREPSLFLDAGIFDRPQVGQDPFFHPHHVHPGKLQTLG